MSISNKQGAREEIELDKPALAAREAIASMSVGELRAFVINLMRACDVPEATIAQLLNCSDRSVRRYVAKPDERARPASQA